MIYIVVGVVLVLLALGWLISRSGAVYDNRKLEQHHKSQPAEVYAEIRKHYEG